MATAPEAPGSSRAAEDPPRMRMEDVATSRSEKETRAALEAEFPEASNYGALTPVTLLALLRSRMRDMDEQVQVITDEINGRTQRAEELTEKLQALHKVQEAGNTDSDKKIAWEMDNPYKMKGGEYKLDEDGDRIPKDDAVYYNGEWTDMKTVVEDLGMEDRFAAAIKDGKVRKQELDNIIQDLEKELKQANSGNELRMVKLQTVMQQRSEAVNMVTNMLKKMNDANEAIVGNMR